MGTDFSAIEGTGSSGVMVVAEASGEHEQRDQLPLRPYAPAGSLYERVLRRMGYSREAFATTNVLRCRPRDNWLDGAPWEHAAIARCRPNLETAIAERRPRCIVALGGIATRELTGQAGPAQGVGHLAGYVLPCTFGNPEAEPVPVVPNFHPAYLRRGKASHQGVFARIMQRALNIAAGKDREWRWDVNLEEEAYAVALGYEVRPTVSSALAYSEYIRSHPQLPLSYDIETSESVSIDEDAREGFADTHIRLVQFAAGGAGAIAIPWEPLFMGAIQSLLHSPNVKCGHNVWLFDNKVLRAAGEREGLDLTPRGTIHDTLQMFHHWQPDLPAHLQFCAQYVSFPFPWKHLAATNIEFYGCCDADATLRLYGFLEGALRRESLWDGYVGQVAAVRPILAAMEDRGLPIDNAARLALDAEFDAMQRSLGAELVAAVPAECCRVHPKDGYKGVPPEVKARIKGTLFGSEAEANAAFAAIATEKFKDSGDDGAQYAYCLRDFPVPAVDAASGEPVATATTRWCRVYDFNPNSSQQLLAYMRARKHPVPAHKHRETSKGKPADTTEKKELIRMATRTGDSFYLKVIQFRELTKARGTYVDGFAPGPDGCVHTTFTFDTAIGQLSSRDPNVQNFPKHGTSEHQRRLFAAMRRMVAARPGHILTEWDFKSCHVLTLGYLAEDETYIRLARLDMHSFVAGHVLGLWDGPTILAESDDDLRARFKRLKANAEWKRVRDDQAKHAILGIGNGLKAKGLYERYMEEFANQRTAKRFLDTAESLFPRVFEWQRRMQKLAHEQQYLRTEFGHIRRFYEVFRWDMRKGAWGHGDQAEQAISFWLSNIAFAHIREAMKALHAAGLDRKYGLFDNIHDAFEFSFPSELLDEHIHDIHPVLVAPSRVLVNPRIAPGGLHIDVECSAGPNWAEMAEVRLPARAPTLAPAMTVAASL